jgi:Sulfotransferase family
VSGTRYTRYVIISSPRSGTHMLRTSLSAHPTVVCLAEMFNPDLADKEPYDASTSERTILDEHVFRKYPPQIEAVGFAIHRSGAPIGSWNGVWRLLEADAELRVILLHRYDLLRRYLSHCIMRERNRSGRREFEPEPRRYAPEALQAEFERYENELASFRRDFAKHAMLQISYEELCDRYEETLTRIQTFLGVTSRTLAPGTQRNEMRPPDRIIENFTELAAAFAKTRWAYFFKPEPEPQPQPRDSLDAACSATVTLIPVRS